MKGEPFKESKVGRGDKVLISISEGVGGISLRVGLPDIDERR